jgi:hypothetical protein
MRKCVIAGLVILALLSSAVVMAAPAPPRGGQGMGRHMGAPGTFTGGTVVSVKRDKAGKLAAFVVKQGDGKSVTIKVNAQTKYSSGFTPASASQVKPKLMVGVQLPKAGVYTAVHVGWRGPEVYTGGAVQSVKLGPGKKLASFVIKQGDGKLITVMVSASTKYFGGPKVTTPVFVKKGAQVGVMFPRKGSNQALSVMAAPPPGAGGPGGGHGGRGGHGGPGGGWGGGRPK